MLATGAARAHPLSYTDAWARVDDDRVQIRLNVFLDDVLRYQTDWTPEQTTLPTEDVREAVQRFGDTLMQRLSVRTADGTSLRFQVTDAATWSRAEPTSPVAADANLKLTWKLTAPIPSGKQPLRALVIRHDLTPPGVDGVGELRLHLQHQTTRRRIDAVIPARRVHAVVLPSSDTAVTDDVNQLQVRLIVTPRVSTVEVEAPLLLMSRLPPMQQKTTSPMAEQQLSKALRKQFSMTAESWFRTSTQLLIDGQLVPIGAASVHFLPLLSEPLAAVESELEESVPVSVVRLGVRLHFAGHSAARRVQLQMLQNPGTFDSATVTLITPRESQTQAVPFTEERPALQVTWNPAPADSLPERSQDDRTAWPAEAAGKSPDLPADATNERSLVNVQVERPGRGGFLWMAGAAVLTLAAVIWVGGRRGRWLILPGLAVALIGIGLFPDVTVRADRSEVIQLTERILNRTYRVLNENPDEAAVRLLEPVLDADLLEQVFVSAAAALPVDAQQPTVVGVNAVSVTSLEVTQAGADQVRTNCRWLVDGTVFHWGHVHRRRTLLSAELTLRRQQKRWKLSRFQLTEPPAIQTEPVADQRS